MNLEPGPGIVDRSIQRSGGVNTELREGDRHPPYRFHLDDILARQTHKYLFQGFDWKRSQGEPRCRHDTAV